jgi:positive regulator of sigma E activity
MPRSNCSLSASAVVVRVRDDSTVDLDLDGAVRCAGCSGVCMWKRVRSERLEKIPTDAPVATGMRVVVTLPERYALLGSLVAHGLPLLGLLAGAVAGSALAGSDAGAVIGAVVGAITVLAVTPVLRRRVEGATLRRLRIRAAA